MSDEFIDTYKLDEKELIALIQGKSLNFYVPGKFHIQVLPPNHGITLAYKDWEEIKMYLKQVNHPWSHTQDFINKIEERK
jgi:hypothetical protein